MRFRCANSISLLALTFRRQDNESAIVLDFNQGFSAESARRGHSLYRNLCDGMLFPSNLREAVKTLKHTVLIGRIFRNDLQRVPVLDDFSLLINSEYIYSRVVVIAVPVLKAMDNNISSLCQDPLYLDALPRPLPGHAFKICYESLFPRFHMRVVLYVLNSDKPIDGFGRTTFIEHQLIKGDHILFIAVQFVHGSIVLPLRDTAQG